MIRVHGTCVMIGGTGVLLRGPSGVGKSDLALRLIDAGARLVADDQVEIWRRDDRLLASAPETINGLLEVRGIGILKLETEAESPLGLVIDLVAADAVERLPEAKIVTFLGLPLPLLALFPREASAAAKVHLALEVVSGNIMPPIR